MGQIFGFSLAKSPNQPFSTPKPPNGGPDPVRPTLTGGGGPGHRLGLVGGGHKGQKGPFRLKFSKMGLLASFFFLVGNGHENYP